MKTTAKQLHNIGVNACNCGAPDCGVILNNPCHPESGMDVKYFTVRDALQFACTQCGKALHKIEFASLELHLQPIQGGEHPPDACFLCAAPTPANADDANHAYLAGIVNGMLGHAPNLCPKHEGRLKELAARHETKIEVHRPGECEHLH